MSRIEIQIFGSRAEIVTVPCVAARILYRRRTLHSWAIRIGERWIAEHTGREVDSVTAAAIKEAAKA